MRKEWRLPAKALRIWQIRTFLSVCLLSAFLCISFSLYLPSAILLILSFFVSVIYLPFLFKSYVISINDSYISVEKGVFIKTTLIMPKENLVYAEAISLPLSNALRLSAVVLKAARHFCVIPEIEKEKADCLLVLTKDGKK